MKKILILFLSISLCCMLISCKADTTNLNISSKDNQVDSSSTSSQMESSSSEVSSTTSSQAPSSNKSSSTKSAPTTATSNNSKNATSAVSSQPVQTVRVTFPEGTTMAKAFDTLEAKGVAKQKELFQTAGSVDFSAYSVVNEIKPASTRCFLLEGYLFPSTYDFYVNEKPESVIRKMLNVSNKRITQAYKDRAAQLGYTMDEMITLASIIQKEAHVTKEFTRVSSVFHNRLKAGMKLQSDVTIKYVEGAIKPYIDGDTNRFNSYYNTYKCKGLPAGPICNPGISAIEAALNPESTNYLYFVNDTAGNYYYAATYEEHQQNCQTAGVTP
ncbi:endolytic transglycosylase MltG [Paludicola sp. MB14-C6]|uniref:endolytic transglycosylase MltG n=1 Tax=Paludihabitans sp. MB14-C6 TaxID=3070656 RepID=UPI0027DDB211|nr:endolytic transglycosylase MltG [Paludicola sp. MB14-C6]WMJ23737.1 endolytic transglycosylase MltG [Paludicola sp. MB14-C6]